jgi:hypothetical protein
MNSMSYRAAVGLVRVAFVAGIATTLSGCFATTEHRIAIAGALPLEEEFTSKAIDNTPAGDARREFIGRAALDSQKKCDEFIDSIVLEEGNANFYGDSASTLLSAVATVAKPINAVHALTAGSTIASGTKNAYLNGFFAQATIANYAMAIQTTYSAAMAQYLNDLPKLGDNAIVSVEIGKIQQIHSRCRLASAQLVIANTLKPQPGSNLSASIDYDPSKPSAQSTTTMTLLLVNASGDDATLDSDLQVSFATSPDGLFNASADIKPSGSCVGSVTLTSKALTWPKGSVIPSGGCTIKLPVKLTQAGTFIATLKAGALSTNKGANSADITGTVTFPDAATAAGVSVSLVYPPTSPTVAQGTTMTLTLKKSDATLKSDLAVGLATNPANLLVPLNGVKFGGSCKPTPKVGADSASFTYPQGSLLAKGGSCTISLPVKLKAPGTLTTSIAAGALNTDQGSNATAVSDAVVFATNGGPTPAPAAMAAPPVRAIAPGANPNGATKACPLGGDIHHVSCP